MWRAAELPASVVPEVRFGASAKFPEPPTTVPALLERLALSQYAEAVAANGWTELQTLLELSEAPAEPPTTPPTSKLFEQAKALMKVGHARRLADMTAQLAAAVRARKQ